MSEVQGAQQIGVLVLGPVRGRVCQQNVRELVSEVASVCRRQNVRGELLVVSRRSQMLEQLRLWIRIQKPIKNVREQMLIQVQVRGRWEIMQIKRTNRSSYHSAGCRGSRNNRNGCYLSQKGNHLRC